MVPASPKRCTKARKCRWPFSASSETIEKSSEAQSARSIRSSSWPCSSIWKKVERRQFFAASPSPVGPYSKTVALVGFGIVPAESAPLEDRMQRVDENQAARQLEAGRPAALAKAADQVVFRQAGEPL